MGSLFSSSLTTRSDDLEANRRITKIKKIQIDTFLNKNLWLQYFGLHGQWHLLNLYQKVKQS